MRKFTIGFMFLVVALAASLNGCAQTGQFTAGNMTHVELSEPNYKAVATSVSGEAEAAYLIGIAFSDGPKSGSLSLHRLRGTGKLYTGAMDSLWKNFAAEHGEVEGRRLALANVRYDAATRNFLVYNDISLSIRADVIEFSE
jgi:hypothetical protein